MIRMKAKLKKRVNGVKGANLLGCLDDTKRVGDGVRNSAGTEANQGIATQLEPHVVPKEWRRLELSANARVFSE